MVAELEKRLFNPNRIINSFIPGVGPFVAAKGLYHNRKYKEEVAAERAAINEVIGQVKADEAKMYEKMHGAKGGDGASEKYKHDFSKAQYDRCNAAVEQKYGPISRIVEAHGYDALRALRNAQLDEGLQGNYGVPSYRLKKKQEGKPEAERNGEVSEENEGDEPGPQSGAQGQNAQSGSRESLEERVEGAEGSGAEEERNSEYKFGHYSAIMGKIHTKYGDDIAKEVEEGIIGLYLSDNNTLGISTSIDDFASSDEGPFKSFVGHVRKYHPDADLEEIDKYFADEIKLQYDVMASEIRERERDRRREAIEKRESYDFSVSPMRALLGEYRMTYGDEVAKELEVAVVEEAIDEVNRIYKTDITRLQLGSESPYEALMKRIEAVASGGARDAYDYDKIFSDNWRDIFRHRSRLGKEWFEGHMPLRAPDKVDRDTWRGMNAEERRADREARRLPQLLRHYSAIKDDGARLDDIGVDVDGRLFLRMSNRPNQTIPGDARFYSVTPEELAWLEEEIRANRMAPQDIIDMYEY